MLHSFIKHKLSLVFKATVIVVTFTDEVQRGYEISPKWYYSEIVAQVCKFRIYDS